ncbi:hypothetical protein CHUAL_008798 [Chamberlinius hualienensis]
MKLAFFLCIVLGVVVQESLCARILGDNRRGIEVRANPLEILSSIPTGIPDIPPGVKDLIPTGLPTGIPNIPTGIPGFPTGI